MRAGREQWKLDLKNVHEKEQLQQRIMNQDAAAGIQNRQALDHHVGSLIHAPGIASEQPPGRSMNISNISARVLSQSGHVIAGPRRETGIIPQAQSAVNRAARIPAVVAPEMVIANGQRGQNHSNQIADDPFLAAVLRISEAGPVQAQAPSSPPKVPSAQVFLNRKVEQETRAVELQNLMTQHRFIKDLDADFPRKTELLKELSQKIFASPRDSFWDAQECPICLAGFEPENKNCSRMPCCSRYMHTSCLFGLLPNTSGNRVCPTCRAVLNPNL